MLVTLTKEKTGGWEGAQREKKSCGVRYRNYVFSQNSEIHILIHILVQRVFLDYFPPIPYGPSPYPYYMT